MTLEKTILSAIVLSLITACGDSDSTNTPTPNPTPTENTAPTANISGSSLIDERTISTFTAENSTDSDGNITSYSWEIDLLENPDAPISLSGSTETANLTVGELVTDIEIMIKLTVTDNGGKSDTQSQTVTIQEIDEDRLPPMPSNPQSTIEGIDSDNDGIRDDVEIAIYNLYKDNLASREILRTQAISYQNSLQASLSDDDRDNDAAAEAMAKSSYCLRNYLSGDFKKQRAMLKSIILDTDARFNAYAEYNRQRSGTIQRTITSTEAECRLAQNQE